MITKTQFNQLIDSDGRAAFAEFEKKIDSAIKSATMCGRGAVIRISVRGIAAAVIEHATSGYAAAGWKVQVIADPRDGDFLELS